ncbi:hypothetical protein pipiens_008858 [Culex pipiens pipiens]|uniref:Dynactin subunit 4 n=1 Tax=Culex pipiens pipiens TaxID=38569 RepID=A0ABD1DG21_CULPP
MGVLKRTMEKEQLLEPVPVFCHDEDKHERSDLRVDWGNIAILFFLYLLQGILMGLRSLRCRQCDHNVTKSEYNPSSIKYRIAMFAAYHAPEVRFIRCEPLMFNQKAILLLKLINPTINDMTITIMELPTDEEERRMIEELKLSAEATVSSSSSSLMLVGRGVDLGYE